MASRTPCIAARALVQRRLHALRGACFAALGLFATSPLASCDDSLPARNGDAAVADSGVAQDVRGDALADGSLPPGPCPDPAPANDQTCARDGLVCSYGDDPRPFCRTRATCTMGAWSVGLTGCPPISSEGCPLATPDANTTCDLTADIFCFYAEVTCGCSACLGGPCGIDALWFCYGPPADERCPVNLPNLGQSCAPSALECHYGSCSNNTNVLRRCEDGIWVEGNLDPCPL